MIHGAKCHGSAAGGKRAFGWWCGQRSAGQWLIKVGPLVAQRSLTDPCVRLSRAGLFGVVNREFSTHAYCQRWGLRDRNDMTDLVSKMINVPLKLAQVLFSYCHDDVHLFFGHQI